MRWRSGTSRSVHPAGIDSGSGTSATSRVPCATPPSTGRTWASRHQDGGQRRRRGPARPLRRLEHLLVGSSGQQQLSDAGQQPLPHAPGRLGLVGVPGDAGRGELVDVGEDQLGEVDQHLAVDAVADRGERHLAPGDPGADPVRREQGVGAAPAPGLAAAELVGALDGGRRRGPQVGATLAAGQREEAAERELHGVADGLAHRPAERVGVARDLLDDRPRPPARPRSAARRASRSRPPSGSAGRARQSVGGAARGADLAHFCLQRTNVTWSFTSVGQEFTRPAQDDGVMATIELPTTSSRRSGARRCAPASAASPTPP